MLNFNKLYLFSLFFSWTFFSCVDEVPFEPEYEQLVTINCLLSNDTIQKLQMVYNNELNGGRFFEEIKEAKTFLYDVDADTLIGSFTKESYATWTLKYKAIAGITYKLKVIVPEYDTISSQTKMPIPQDIRKNISSDLYYSKNYEWNRTEASCNYWIFGFRTDTDIPPILPDPKPSGKDRLLNEIGTNHPYVDKFNVSGNLTDIIPEANTEAYNFYIRILSNQVQENNIRFQVQGNLVNSFVCFRQTSYEYDQYLKTSLRKMFIYMDEDDPGAWFDESNIYSNIENGIGIFGAYIDVVFYYNKNF